MKELIQDKVYENTMLVRLDQTRELIQAMVDEWNALDYRPCDSESMLYDLAYNSQQMIDEGKAQKEADSEGLSTQQKADYLRKLRFKNADSFRIAAAKVTQDPYSERGQNLYVVRDGAVTLNKKSADEILKKNSVIAQTKEQEALGEKILMIRDLFNEVNRATYGSMKLSVNDLFATDYRNNGADTDVVLNLSVLRRLLTFA